MTDAAPQEARDPHLRAALQHAPDAQVQAPPQVSAFILSEAQAKARDGATAPRPKHPPRAALWHWLGRPGLATGLASVLAATVVLMMWWDQPMDEALPRRPAPAQAVAPSSPPKPPPQPSTAAPTAAPAVTTATAPAAPAALRKTAPPSRTPADKLAEAAADQRQDSAERRAAAVPAPAAVAPQAEAAGALSDQAAAKQEAPAEARRLRAAAAPAPTAMRAETAASHTLAELRAAIAAEPSRWSWQRGPHSAQAMNDAMLAWLAQLDAAASSGWHERSAVAKPAPLGDDLRLLRDGQLVHHWQLAPGHVVWHRRGQAAWQAELPDAAALRSALDRATP